MDEQMIEQIAKAIELPFLPHGYELKPHLLKVAARAAHSVMSARVAELEEALDDLRLSAARVANKYGRDPTTDELLDWTEWQNVRDHCERAAALAPHPKGTDQ